MSCEWQGRQGFMAGCRYVRCYEGGMDAAGRAWRLQVPTCGFLHQTRGKFTKILVSYNHYRRKMCKFVVIF